MRRWARRRQGSDPLQLTLRSERIYVLPTRAGMLYAVMLAAMLAGALNYGNNLAFALTFLLAGLGLVGVYHTHRGLCGLRLHYLGAEPVHAGDPLVIRLSLSNDAELPRHGLVLDWYGDQHDAGDVPARSNRVCALPLATQRRGTLALPALRLSTCAPLGLVRAWTWIHFNARPLVYPRPAPAASAHPQQGRMAAGDGASTRGDDDLAGLRDYQPGDSPRRIAWKSYARSGLLLVREYRGGAHDETVWFDWDDTPGSGIEVRVALLTRQVLDACSECRKWGLRLPGTRIEPAQGHDHLHRCLRALAVTGLPTESAA